MKKLTALIVTCMGFGICFLLESGCTNPQNPYTTPAERDTVNTIWTKQVSPNGLASVLYYGSTASFQISAGDSDGDSVSIALSGIPASTYIVTHSHDTSFVSLNLVGDSLLFDSLYTIKISISGVDSIDTLNLHYPIQINDSTRLGGVKKFTKGLSWVVEKIDSTASLLSTTTKDSTIATHSSSIHRILFTMMDEFPYLGQNYWLVAMSDTNISDKRAVAKNTFLIMQTATSIEYITAAPEWPDSLRTLAYKLPLKSQTNWSVVNTQKSISGAPVLNGITLHLTTALTITSNATMAQKQSILFESTQRPCFTINTATNYLALMKFDAPVRFGDSLIAAQGDTAELATSTIEQTQSFSDFHGIALKSSEKTITKTEKPFDFTVTTDTFLSTSTVISYTRP